MGGDRRSFLMDFFFPLLLIWAGQYISTVELISDVYPRRELSAYQFPQGRPLFRNLHNFNQTDGEVSEFVEKNFGSDIGPGKLFSEDRPINVNTTSHFFDQVKEVDNAIYNERGLVGAQYGDFFFQ